VRLDTLDKGADYINLFSKSDPDFVVDQGYSGTTSSIVVAAGNSVTGFIKINNGETVYGTLDGSNMFGTTDTTKLGIYDINKNWIETRRIYQGYLTTPYVATADCYIRVQYVSTRTLVVSTLSRKKIAKDYVDYFSGDISTLQSNVSALQSAAGLSGVDLIIFMGQSNMSGRGDVSQAPSLIPGAGYEFRAISDPTKLYTLQEPFGGTESNPSGINDAGHGDLVMAFVNAYYTYTKTPIVGISAAKGGTTISQWQSGGTYLPDAINRLTTAKNWLNSNGYKINHIYMVWLQGESDADSGTLASDYTSNFNTMLASMKGAGVEKCFLIRVGSASSTTMTNSPTNLNNIISAQTTIGQTNNDVVMIATITTSLTILDQYGHFNQDEYNTLGNVAGTNAAFFRTRGKEPTMYDSKNDNLYFSKKYKNA
jgi:hypothetical protein